MRGPHRRRAARGEPPDADEPDEKAARASSVWSSAMWPNPGSRRGDRARTPSAAAAVCPSDHAPPAAEDRAEVGRRGRQGGELPDRGHAVRERARGCRTEGRPTATTQAMRAVRRGPGARLPRRYARLPPRPRTAPRRPDVASRLAAARSPASAGCGPRCRARAGCDRGIGCGAGSRCSARSSTTTRRRAARTRPGCTGEKRRDRSSAIVRIAICGRTRIRLSGP